MNCRITDLKNKEVINIKDGSRLGCINELEIDMKCAKIVAIVIFGKPKCFGLFGREEDIIIRWEDIEVIGDDAILVLFKCRTRQKRHQGFFRKMFPK